MEHSTRRGFLSDNASPVHPMVMNALLAANAGHAIPYGGDSYTQEMQEAFNYVFQRKVFAFPVFNGTGANVLALAHATTRYSSVLCTSCAHIVEDECGAPEHMLGCKLVGLPHENGKIRPDFVEEQMDALGSQHAAQPAVLSLSQLTECGTAYAVEEIRALTDLAHRYGLLVHMDGARLANAVATLGCSVAEMTCDAGVDVLSFGGTKNAMMFGEAVIFFDEKLAKTFPFTRKNNGQLYSKSRYIAAQFTAVLRDNLWLRTASHANRMAKKLSEGLCTINGVDSVYPVDGNEVFVTMPEQMFLWLNERYAFSEHLGQYRLVTSFDTEEKDVEHFVALAAEHSKK